MLNHSLRIYGDRYVAVNEEQIPTSELLPVQGTPLVFLEYTKIGQRINAVEGGYDHTFVLNKAANSFGPVASLRDTLSGRTLDVFSTEPGVQFYSGNFLDGTLTGRSGIKYVKHYGLCLEAQHFPDSPNHADFPSVVLIPGKKYKQHTVYRFGVKLF
jgi:aldose 1-epimerase